MEDLKLKVATALGMMNDVDKEIFEHEVAAMRVEESGDEVFIELSGDSHIQLRDLKELEKVLGTGNIMLEFDSDDNSLEISSGP